MPQPSAFAQVTIGGDVLRNRPMLYRPSRTPPVIGAPCKDHNLRRLDDDEELHGLLGGARNQFHQQIHGVTPILPT